MCLLRCVGDAIPGGNARASLKRCVRRVRPPIAGPDYPGRKRPGLIEAEAANFGFPDTCDAIPGGNARASLKPFPFRPRVSTQGPIPGGNARASLKRHRPARGPRLPRPIPGGNARASLKLVQSHRILSVRRGSIPGGNARASLKPRWPWVNPPTLHAAYPGRKRPGLIEAFTVRGACIRARKLSRAETPGPH